jgi:hypothetical protein
MKKILCLEPRWALLTMRPLKIHLPGPQQATLELAL